MKTVKNEDLLRAEKKIELEILEIGHAFVDTQWNYQNVCYTFSQVYIPIRGEAQLLHRGHAVDLLPGNVYIVPAGLQYSCHCSGYLEKYLIDFCVSQADGIDLLAGIDRCLILRDAPEFVEMMRQAYEETGLRSVIKIRRILLQVLDRLLCSEVEEPLELSSYSASTEAALQYIDQNLSAQLTIRQIAEALYISRLALQKHFREDIGKPIGKYIDERIIACAQRQLKDPVKSIKEISDTLGFCDQFYFCRVFKQKCGMTPSQYRKSSQA